MATLTGKIIDVTSRPPDSISSITVKAPSARIGSGTDVIVSSPAEVTFNKTTGDVTISGLTGGLSWLYIEGDGWSDSIPLAVAEGMITLVEAIANAAGAPGMADYISLLSQLEGRVEDIAQDAVDAAAENIKWDRGVVGADITSLDQLELGSWGVGSTTVAENLGLPGTLGNLTVSRIATGKSVLYRTLESGTQKHQMWMTSITGGVVAPWKRIDSASTGASGGVPGLKTVGVTLTAGSALDGTAGRCRVLAQVTAPVTRWRVHIESRRQVFTSTADFTLGAVSVGKHSGDGNMSGATSLKSGNTSISGSSEWVSRWVTNDLSEETLIDFNVSGTGLYSYQAGAYRLNGSTWEPATNVPAAVWIEVETYSQTPVVAMIGDSTGAGQGADRPVHDSALHVAARNHGFIPMNYSYPGSSMESMANPDHHIYKRWEHLSKPDSVIVQSGSNDIHGGTSTADLQTRFNNLAELARGISPVVFGATVKARYPNSGDFATALTAHNTYVKTQPAQTRDYLDFYAAVSPIGTVAAGDAADAAHLSTAGHAKLAGAFEDITVSRPKVGDSALETMNNPDLAFAVVDKDGRRTWLEAGTDGKPTNHARKHIHETIETNDLAFGVVDEEGRRTWLEVAPDGGPTDRARDFMGGGLSIPDFPTSDWVHWGDSNTDDHANKEDNWTNLLSGMTGANHHNGGYWGQGVEHIAARQGGAPSLITLANNRTSATGATDIVDATNLVVADNVDYYTVAGSLAGVPGIITPHAGGVHTFTPHVPGVYEIPPRSVFTPDTEDLRDRHVTIWMGRNNRYEDGAPEKIARSTRHMIDYLTPRVKRVLVLQLVPGVEGINSNLIKSVNDRLQMEFPSQFVPIAEWLMTDEAATLAGITYTEQDLTDISEGRIPASFRRDNAHFNEVGCIPIAHFLHREITERGWL